MNGTLHALLLTLLLAVCGTQVFAGEVPPLKDLRKPVEEAVVEEEAETVLPDPVNEANRVADPARLCPDDAVWYITVPDAARFVGHWQESPSGAFVNEPSMQQTFRNNRFGLNYLFSDLPESVITSSRIGSIAAAFELSNGLAKISEKMAMASYIDEEGNFSFLFVFDVGLDRVPAFETMGEWETFFFLANPGSDVKRGNHSGNYLDIWTIKERMADLKSSEIVAGFAENMAIVSNNPELAAKSLALLSGGASVADSVWGGRLAASLATSQTADAIAFLRMDALLKGLEHTPIARSSVVAWADYLGHGGRDGEAIYYGLEFTPEGSRETYLLPASGQTASASLIELLAKRLKPAEKWTTPLIFPSQPNLTLFMAALLEGRQLGGILRQERRIFGTMAEDKAFTLPQNARRLFTNELINILTGEIGIAFYPSLEGDKQPWLMVLPCTRSPENIIGKANNMFERSGATIYSNETNWRNTSSWTVISSARFRKLTGDYLVIASEGELILATIDNLVGGSSFTNNRDFSRAIEKSEQPQGMFFYINTPEVVAREYPYLPALMRALYPRSSGLNSRPPLPMLRRYAKGCLGTIVPSTNGEEFTRLTVQAPMPTLGAITGSVVLTFPRSLRSDGRNSMEQSRQNMRTIWLRLQLYASRFGHFPDSLEDLAADMRSPEMSNDILRGIFTAPAALSRMTPEEAARSSYSYLSGITPNDEPDIPIVYESEPWSEDFTGWYPTTLSGRGPSESGEYLPYRQYIRLDGQVVVMPEKRFRDKVLPRLQERE